MRYARKTGILDRKYTMTNPAYIEHKNRTGDRAPWLKKTVWMGGVDMRFYPPSVPYFAQDKGLEVDSESLCILPKFYTSIALRDYQIKAFNYLVDKTSALCEMKTGGGKSVLAAALCEVWEGRTLVVLHSQDMIKQFKETFKEFLKMEVGAYYTKEKNIQDITLTTFASASGRPELWEGFDNIIIDECDTFFTDKQRAWLCSHRADRKIGFTGTVDVDKYDKYEKERVLPRFWGNHYKCGADFSADVEKVIVKTYNSGVPVKDMVENWVEKRQELDADMERLHSIVDFAEQHYKSGDSMIVLLDRIEHINYLAESLSMIPTVCHGGLSKKDRENDLGYFKKHGGLLVAQFKTAGRGTDVPACNKIMIAFPNKQESGLRQMVGRAVRRHGDKKATIYDFVDSSLIFQFNKRKRVYGEHFGLTDEDFYESS